MENRRTYTKNFLISRMMEDFKKTIMEDIDMKKFMKKILLVVGVAIAIVGIATAVLYLSTEFSIDPFAYLILFG